MNVGALALFAFVSSITPGPNNIMLWGSGMNFGLRRTTPHLLGVNLGFASLIFMTNLGLGALFLQAPVLNVGLRIVGSLYLLFLAFKVATAAGPLKDASTAEPGESFPTDRGPAPLTFGQAAAFQYVNPKAWIMAATSASTFLPEDQPLFIAALGLTVAFALVNLPCIATWAAAGTALGRLLTNDRRRQVVNGTLGVLLIGTTILINI